MKEKEAKMEEERKKNAEELDKMMQKKLDQEQRMQ